MKKLIVILVLMAFFLPNGMPILLPQEGSKQIETKLAQLVADLENNLIIDTRLNIKMKLIVRGFTYDQDGMEATSAFSEYLVEKVEAMLKEAKQFSILPRSEVKDMVHSRDWKVEEASPALPENLGAVAGADAILIGKFEDFNTKIKISALVRDIRSREVISDASVLIPKEAVPAAIAVFSENYGEVSFADLVDEPEDTLDMVFEDIHLEVFVDHSVDNQYKAGENMKIYIKADKDCYIRVLYRDTQGEDLMLFPRRETDNDFIKANQTYVIPPDNSYKIVAVEPYGTECLKVFASSRPFGGIQSVSVETIRERGMRIEDDQSPPAYGEKSVTIRVAPKGEK